MKKKVRAADQNQPGLKKGNQRGHNYRTIRRFSTALPRNRRNHRRPVKNLADRRQRRTGQGNCGRIEVFG